MFHLMLIYKFLFFLEKKSHLGTCIVPESQGNKKKTFLGYIKNNFIHPQLGKPRGRLGDKLPTFIIIHSINTFTRHFPWHTIKPTPSSRKIKLFK